MLSEAQYGEVATAVSLSQVCGLVLALGYPGAISRHVLKVRGGHQSGPQLAVLAATLGAVVGGIAFSFAIFLLPHSPAYMGFLMGSCISAYACFAACMRSMRKPLQVVCATVLMSVLPPIAGNLSLFLVTKRPEAYLFGVFLTQLAIAVFLIGVLFEAKWRVSREHISKTTQVALPTLPHLLAVTGATSAVPLLARLISGPEFAGQAQLSWVVAGAPVLLLGAVNQAWATEAMSMSPQNRDQFNVISMRVMAWGLVSVTIAVGLAAPLALPLIAPRQFADFRDAQVFPAVFAGAGVMMLPYISMSHAVFATGRTKVLMFRSPLCLVLSVVVAVGMALVFDPVFILAIPVSYYALLGVALASGGIEMKIRDAYLAWFPAASVCFAFLLWMATSNSQVVWTIGAACGVLGCLLMFGLHAFHFVHSGPNGETLEDAESAKVNEGETSSVFGRLSGAGDSKSPVAKHAVPGDRSGDYPEEKQQVVHVPAINNPQHSHIVTRRTQTEAQTKDPSVENTTPPNCRQPPVIVQGGGPPRKGLGDLTPAADVLGVQHAVRQNDNSYRS